MRPSSIAHAIFLSVVGIVALLASCRDQAPLPTTPNKRPSETLRDVVPAPTVEFYVHGAPEDWQLFMGNLTVPSLLAGTKVVLLHTTAGDAGRTATFWQARERGANASVDTVLGAGTWTCASQTVNAHPIRRCVRANVVEYFMRMPDGNYADGTGYGKGSLKLLRDNGTATNPVDNSTTYASWADFTSTVQAIIDFESQGHDPTTVKVHTPDYDRTINAADHPDNFATADAVRAAIVGRSWTVAWYVDYNTENLPVNLSSADQDIKQKVFTAYDNVMVNGGFGTESTDPEIQAWLQRTYFRVPSVAPPAAPSSAQATASLKSRIDLTWTDNATTESGFTIERAPDVSGAPGTFAQIATVGANVTSYSDWTVSASTKYWYHIRAFNDGGSSANSNNVSATTPATNPLPYRGDAYIVAHEDDWQIFMGDRTVTSFQTAASMLFIYVTAGDGGNTASYWQARERGALSSVDTITGTVGPWNCANRTVRTHPIWRCTKNNVVQYFMRMPDGNFVDGTGYGHGSLKTLRDQGTATKTIDNSTTYTSWADLYNTVGAIVDLEFDNQSAPNVQVHTQEYDRVLDPNDHSDHNATGDAVKATATSHVWNISWYVDYDTEHRPINLTAAQHATKLPAFYACNNVMLDAGYNSDVNDPEYQAWVWRTYFRQTQGVSSTLVPPSNLAASSPSSTQINLSWSDNSSDEAAFYIERAPDNNGAPGTFAQIATVGANVTTYSNTGLAPATKYWYRVQAQNGSGVSTYTNNASATTLPPPPPVAPSGLTLTVLSGSQIKLTWTDNSPDETGFRIERAPDAGGVAGAYTEIATVGVNVATFTNTGLAPTTTYWYRVRAYNAGGTSGYTNESSATTATGKPNAPTGLTATASSSTAIALAWADNSTDETGFLVESAPDNGGVAGTYAQIASLGANVTSYSNTGLTASTTYWYRVRAAGLQNSDYSNEASATTLIAKPLAPSAFTATPVSGSEIDLTWTDNANNEASFTLQRAPDNNGVAGSYATVATLAVNATSYNNTGLAANTKYWYRIRTNNSAGSSAYVVTNAMTFTVPPNAPSNIAAKTTTAATTATITWADNSADETGFRIEQAPDNGGVPGAYVEVGAVGVNVKTYTASGLTGATKYWFRVRAYSAYGNSAYTADASMITALPTNLTVTKSSLTAVLAWTPGAGAKVDVWRDATKFKSGLTNSGTVNDGGRVAGTTYVYKVCNVGLTDAANCSNTFSITF